MQAQLYPVANNRRQTTPLVFLYFRPAQVVPDSPRGVQVYSLQVETKGRFENQRRMYVQERASGGGKELDMIKVSDDTELIQAEDRNSRTPRTVVCLPYR